jgi:hypothetical protein
MFLFCSTRESVILDWAGAIERNREALTAIVAALFAMLGSVAGPRIPRPLHRAVLRILRPAESAVRRLIVIAARGLVVKPVAARPGPKGLKIPRKGQGAMAFQLFDPRQRFAAWRPKPIPEHKRPRARLPFDERPPGTLVFRPEDFGRSEPPPKDDSVDATRLSRRLEALKLALGDLPRQAKRLVRWQAKREAMRKRRPTFTAPLRPGHPPGYRKKPQHEVDEVLQECDRLAGYVERLDTS